MVETIGDRIEARVNPALADGRGDSEYKISSGGEGDSQVAESVEETVPHRGLPTQVELATLQRVPAKIPWRGKCHEKHPSPATTPIHFNNSRPVLAPAMAYFE